MMIFKREKIVEVKKEVEVGYAVDQYNKRYNTKFSASCMVKMYEKEVNDD